MKKIKAWWRRVRNPLTDSEMQHLLWKCTGSTQCEECDRLIVKLKALLESQP